MRRTPIISGMVGLVLLLFVAILFVAARSAPPPITLRHIKSVPSGGAIKMTFEITNHTTTRYSLVLVCIEVHDGPVWRKCSDFGRIRPGDVLDPNSVATSTVFTTNLTSGHSLRLRMVAHEPLTGLSRFARRFKLWVRYRKVSLDPLDNTVFFNETRIVSDEFVQP